MPLGPVDFMFASFEGGEFHGQMAKALADLVEKGLIHIIDLVFIRKEEDGTLTTLEIDELGDLALAYGELEGEYGGLVSDEDLAEAAAELEPGTAAALLVWENVWAKDFADAMRSAGGQVLVLERIPAEAVEASYSELDETLS